LTAAESFAECQQGMTYTQLTSKFEAKFQEDEKEEEKVDQVSYPHHRLSSS
jgi:hypothetical protein